MHLAPCQTPTMELFWENNYRFFAVPPSRFYYCAYPAGNYRVNNRNTIVTFEQVNAGWVVEIFSATATSRWLTLITLALPSSLHNVDGKYHSVSLPDFEIKSCRRFLEYYIYYKLWQLIDNIHAEWIKILSKNRKRETKCSK